jgi:putative ubiquitin-RnfH superfamily antitoxin RatB of RatAB toxin-antitoxin module
MNNSIQISRAEFMAFFRDEDSLNTLTVDDRIEIFRTVLLGSSDFEKKLFDEMFVDYGVRGLEVVEK